MYIDIRVQWTIIIITIINSDYNINNNNIESYFYSYFGTNFRYQYC